MPEYSIEDLGTKRILRIGQSSYETPYSKRIIELIIERKGIEKTPKFFRHKYERGYFLTPLFDYLNSRKLKGLRVLEVGCGAGHFTEIMQEQSCFDEIYAFEVDRLYVDICRLKIAEMKLDKVKSVECIPSIEAANLKYPDNYFDIIIVFAVLEHLPFENRSLYVDEYYRKLKTNGLICFLDSPNRNFPLEKHSVGLPFISKFSPQTAFIYAKVFGKLKNVEFADFVHTGTGWRNASYYDCLPKQQIIDITDVTEEVGYGYKFFKGISHSFKFKLFFGPYFAFLNFFSKRLGFPMSFFLPDLFVVFKKLRNYEKDG